MKLFSHAPHLAALLLSLSAASHARADWLSSLTYSVAVSTSPSGPFTPTVSLWTPSVNLSGASSPLDAMYTPQGPIFNGNAYLPLGQLTVTYASSETSPSFPTGMPFSFQVTPPGKKSLVLSSQLSILHNGTVSFASGGALAVNVGNRTFDITLEAIGGAIPAGFPGGGQPYTFVQPYEIYAVVPVADLAAAPEPSSLMLAGIGTVALLGVSRRRRRLRPI
jgi:hypothetical protein